MSKLFYKSISEMLVNKLGGFISPGDRFFLRLDEVKEAEDLITALRERKEMQPFLYTHRSGSKYQTFSLDINGIKLVIASTTENVTPDFLVTLRNEVGDQKDNWKNTALLSIVTEQLDSIQGGSSSLQKEGMPLHPESLYNYLNERIKSSNLSSEEATILQYILEHLDKDKIIQQINFLDFKEIFRVIEKGYISEKDYLNFGLFKDHEIENKSPSELKNRLNENFRLFEKVKNIHEFSNSVDDELEKIFSEKGVNLLKQENWNETRFSDVFQANEEKVLENKGAKVTLNKINVPHMDFWEKPLKENTAAGKRKRQIIIFNENNSESVELHANFELSGENLKSLKQEYVRVPKEFQPLIEYQIGNKNLKIKLKPSTTEPTFARISYKHNKKASLGAEFHIVILPFGEEFISSLKTSYTVNTTSKGIEVNSDKSQILLGNTGLFMKSVEVDQPNKLITLSENEGVDLRPQVDAYNDKGELFVYVQVNEYKPMKLLIINELPETTPINASKLWKMKRELQSDFILHNNRLIIGNREFYRHAEFSTFLNWEEEWLAHNILAARVETDLLYAEELKINEPLKDAYFNLQSYFINEAKTLPTLAHVSSKFVEVATIYLREYIEEIQNIRNDSEARKRVDLMKLGTQREGDSIYLTPFHPLVVGYQLQITKMIGSEEIDKSILDRLNPNGLLPYIYDEKDQLYKPDTETNSKEWIKYRPVSEVSIADATSYLGKVVYDKLEQFEEHFTYLFVKGSKSPIKVNLVNMSNDEEALKGIIEWFIDRVKKAGKESVNPIEVSVYLNENKISAFDTFSKLNNPEEVYEKFGLKLKSTEYDERDLLRFIRENIFYYKYGLKDSLRYSHLTFYKMTGEEKYAIQPMSEMKTGISLDGLLSSVPSMKNKDSYVTGFGIKEYEFDDDTTLLLQVAKSLNELAANVSNQGFNSYNPGQAIMSRTLIEDETSIDNVFESSYWVTFVDPVVDLEFFQNYNSSLVVIHYSDQYSSSSRYDAITVTDKSTQYRKVILEFLKTKNIDIDENKVNHVIRAFNAFNGEWLLRIVGSKGHYDKEKLSIISAIKYAMAFFNHTNILWVPVSLEEVLRVAGAVGLNKGNGVFTAKNLGVKGSHSDDLLLIGLDYKNDKIQLHFFPIEVKIGQNYSQVIDKAKDQINKTKKLLVDNLTDEDSNNINFSRKFYRQFFVQLFLSNLNKLFQSDLWPEKGFYLTDDIKAKLLSDDFEISEELVPLIGKGAIVSFENDRYVSSVRIDEQVTLLNLPIENGYKGVIESIEHLFEKISSGKSDLPTEKLLYNNYKVSDTEIPEEPIVNDGAQVESLPKETETSNSPETTIVKNPPKAITDIEKVRVLIGTVEGSNKSIYWEFGNKQLANRHLLISGKSGQGKTYFMQCLLLEQALQGIPSIVIDYTEGFLPNQLETEFVNELDNKLDQWIVYNSGFPINPFKRNTRNIGGIDLEEDETDVAERIKSVFSSVYTTLGVQQLNAIYEATRNGVKKYGEQMNLIQLRYELEDIGSSYARNAVSQISNLIDRNPFRSTDNEMDWGKIINSDGTVNVIQLTGYPRDVQLMITEFILWDLWNYSVREGNKDIPIPVVMDEAQNLDHRENSPSARILTEGRKFGWSGWYATQFLKSQLDSDELARLQNASQKIYFSPPEQEISNIASSIANDNAERKRWEKILSSLQKGQCVIHGPIVKEDGNLSKPIAEVVNISSLSERYE
ncbi:MULTISPECIES: DNA phosphorothioation-dependent restriction protein DptH [Allobacillus]|uniref:DNA phosphorothioation-dependent restriction protein DptH n=1 Tax=Allobacillus salarius TaxID=1955272 RepID=A0A556PBT0_9BACI|nr:DNA phosphorothioation-dependent restriction protein DptH [Allobacillus salarius]TSJ61859.1 DNA phosphorothioation-dependent restriction protein DptH [Allobacillus salarius]